MHICVSKTQFRKLDGMHRNNLTVELYMNGCGPWIKLIVGNMGFWAADTFFLQWLPMLGIIQRPRPDPNYYNTRLI